MQEFFSTLWGSVKAVEFGWKNIIEILLLAFIAYYFFVWIKNSRTWFLFKGIVVLLVFVGLARLFELNVITFIADRTLSVLVIALLIIFQPELRMALEQLGQQKYISKIFGPTRRNDESLHTEEVTQALLDAVYAMAMTKTGALIALEREISLEDPYIKTGIRLDALVSSALLVNIFEHNTPLHDGAVIMRGARIVAATCYLPLTASMDVAKELGTRHRAAIGLSEETDSLVIVVSEETGLVSVAVGGELKHGLMPEELRSELSVMEMRQNKTSAGSSRRKKSKRRGGADQNRTDAVIDDYLKEQEEPQDVQPEEEEYFEEEEYTYEETEAGEAEAEESPAEEAAPVPAEEAGEPEGAGEAAEEPPVKTDEKPQSGEVWDA